MDKKPTNQTRIFNTLVGAWNSVKRRLIVEDPDPAKTNAMVKAGKNAINEFAEWFEQEYRSTLRIKAKKTMPKWVYKHKSISKALEKTRFEYLWEYITAHTMDRNKATALAGERNFGSFKTKLKKGKRAGHTVEYPYVLFVPDYPDMNRQLNIKKNELQKYLKKMRDAGILKRLGKTGERGTNCYAAGYHRNYQYKEGVVSKEGTKREWFFKETTEIKQALKNFKIR